jgi:hypothetical protein
MTGYGMSTVSLVRTASGTWRGSATGVGSVPARHTDGHSSAASALGALIHPSVARLYGGAVNHPPTRVTGPRPVTVPVPPRAPTIYLPLRSRVSPPVVVVPPVAPPPAAPHGATIPNPDALSPGDLLDGLLSITAAEVRDAVALYNNARSRGVSVNDETLRIVLLVQAWAIIAQESVDEAINGLFELERQLDAQPEVGDPQA